MQLPIPTVLKPALIGLLWSAIQSPAEPAPMRGEAKNIAASVASGWIAMLEIEAMTLNRLPGIGTMRVEDLLSIFGIEAQWTYPRPGQTPKGLFGTRRVAIADFAHLLIRMERAGLAIDPAPMVAALAPTLAKREILTGPELSVHWYARERHRCAPLAFSVGPAVVGKGRPDRHKTLAGYRAEMYRDETGAPSGLEVTAPRWRPARADA